METTENIENVERDPETNLIINYLPQTLSDEEFRCMFLSIGPIKSAKIIRDRTTGYSYGFGFVDYQTKVDAVRAINTLNGLQMQNKKIKVALARQGGENIKGANLYIRNLPVHWKDNELNEYFQPFGVIIQCRVLVDNSGNSKRVGFVLYDKKSEADNAIKSLSGKPPYEGAEPLLIKFADDNSKKVRPPAVQHGLGAYQQPPFKQVPGPGPMRNQGGRFRYNPMNAPGGYGTAGWATNGTDRGNRDGYVLFVYNIGYDATEKTLYELFSPFGSVLKVNVIYDFNKNQCKGYGFVTMSSYQQAQYAINCLNGYYYQGRPLQVSLKADMN